MSANGAPEGLAAAIRRVSDHGARVVRLEVELARMEVAGRVRRLRRVAALGGLAAVLLVFGTGFALASAAAALASGLTLWLSLLVVAGALLAGSALLVALALAALRRARSAAPARALEEARRVRAALRDGGVR